MSTQLYLFCWTKTVRNRKPCHCTSEGSPTLASIFSQRTSEGQNTLALNFIKISLRKRTSVVMISSNCYGTRASENLNRIKLKKKKNWKQIYWIQRHSVLFVRLCSIVCFQMSPQIACKNGGIATLVAFVWFFSTVCFQMWPQCTWIRACIVTLVTFI